MTICDQQNRTDSLLFEQITIQYSTYVKFTVHSSSSSTDDICMYVNTCEKSLYTCQKNTEKKPSWKWFIDWLVAVVCDCFVIFLIFFNWKILVYLWNDCFI